MPFGTDGPATAGGRRRGLLALAVAAFAVSSWLAHGGLREPAFDVDTFDYAQMARQLYRGEGFTMLQTFPYVQRYLVEHGHPASPPWANTTRFPLIAVEEAAAFLALGPGDTAILATGGALFVATVLVVFLLGERLAGPRWGPWGGALAATALATDAAQLRISRSGLLETGAGFFLVLAALALVRCCDDDARSRRWALLAGAAAGLAFLQRYDFLVTAPVAFALLFALRGPRPAAHAIALAAGFAVTAGPWIVRNLVVVGTVLGSTSIDRNLLGGVVPGDVYMGGRPVDPWSVALEHWPALLAKFRVAADWLRLHATELPGSRLAAVAGLVALAAPVLARRRAVLAAWALLVGVVAARTVLLSLMHHETRFYLSYVPLVYALAAAVLLRLAARAGLERVAPFVAAAAAVAAVASLPSGSWAARPATPPPVFARIAERLPPASLVASDNSWHVAWYSERPSIRFSGEWRELVDIEAAGVRVDAVMMRGPSGLAFDAAHRAAGGSWFAPRLEFPSGYRLWMRRADSPPLAHASAPAASSAPPAR